MATVLMHFTHIIPLETYNISLHAITYDIEKYDGDLNISFD